MGNGSSQPMRDTRRRKTPILQPCVNTTTANQQCAFAAITGPSLLGRHLKLAGACVKRGKSGVDAGSTIAAWSPVVTLKLCSNGHSYIIRSAALYFSHNVFESSQRHLQHQLQLCQSLRPSAGASSPQEALPLPCEYPAVHPTMRFELTSSAPRTSWSTPRHAESTLSSTLSSPLPPHPRNRVLRTS